MSTLLFFSFSLFLALSLSNLIVHKPIIVPSKISIISTGLIPFFYLKYWCVGGHNSNQTRVLLTTKVWEKPTSVKDFSLRLHLLFVRCEGPLPPYLRK